MTLRGYAMADDRDDGWLTLVQGVASDASAEARIRRHWSDDGLLLARAAASSADGVLFDIAMRDFDRLVGAA